MLFSWHQRFPPPFVPTGVPFPKNFMSVAKTILKRLFRVYAHIYHQHFDSVMQLQEEAHLNTSFKHFIFFVQVRLSRYNVRFNHFCVSEAPFREHQNERTVLSLCQGQNILTGCGSISCFIHNTPRCLVSPIPDANCYRGSICNSADMFEQSQRESFA